MEKEAILWLIAIIVFTAAEAATANLVSLWFVGGSVAAFAAALCGLSVGWQVGLFLGVSALLLACLRPLVRRSLSRRVPDRTNADRVLGEEAVVTEDIDNLQAQGAVKIFGTIWTARSSSGASIPAGKTVIVDRIEGVKLLVSPAPGHE